MNVACEQCGIIVQRTPYQIKRATHTFCSRDCMYEFRRRRITVKCDHCGLEHERRLSAAKDREHYFCSADCQREFMKGGNHPRWGGGLITVECGHCRATIERPRYDVVNSENVFCDRDCYAAYRAEHQFGENTPNWRGGPMAVACAECGTRLARYEHSVGTHAFCNHECYGAHCSRVRRGERHPNWQGGVVASYGEDWPEQRRKALQRDDHKCVLCGRGRGELGIEVAVHHIVPYRYAQTNALPNLVCLCQSHHMKVEAGKQELPARVLKHIGLNLQDSLFGDEDLDVEFRTETEATEVLS